MTKALIVVMSMCLMLSACSRAPVKALETLVDATSAATDTDPSEINEQLAEKVMAHFEELKSTPPTLTVTFAEPIDPDVRYQDHPQTIKISLTHTYHHLTLDFIDQKFQVIDFRYSA